MEDDILREIAAQLAKDGKVSDTSKWRIRQLARSGRFDKRAAAIIAGYSEAEQGQALDMVLAAAQTEIGYLDNAVQAANAAGLSEYFSDIPAETSALNAAKAFQRQAASDLNLVNTVMQYKAGSAFVNAVNSVYNEANRQDVLDVMGKSSAKVVMGHMSLQEATRKTIRELARKGIPAFVDKAGREWSPEAYIMMDMRSTLGNTARAAQDMRCDQYGIQLIEVSSHMGARPLCAPYQGRIFSRDGSKGITTDGAGGKIYYTPISETSYGQPAGLFGINCGHVQYPFAPGINFQRYFPYPKEENDRRYQQFQRQRAMERDIRATKRECMMLQETGDTEGLQKASQRLRAQKQKYSQYSKDCGLGTHYDRTQVYGYDRSKSAKTVWAERKSRQEIIASNDKMASPYSNDWSKTVPKKHSQAELDEISAYAKERGIKLYQPQTFDGDIEMLRQQINTISSIKAEYNINQKITLEFANMIDDDFAVTVNNTIRFNNKAMRNAAITNLNLNSDNQLAATDFTGIAVHEMGHIISNKYGEKGLDIAHKAYYNIFKEEISTDDLLKYLTINVSGYASEPTIMSKKLRYKEITPEILSKSKSSSSSNFADEFIKLLKEAYL